MSLLQTAKRSDQYCSFSRWRKLVDDRTWTATPTKLGTCKISDKISRLERSDTCAPFRAVFERQGLRPRLMARSLLCNLGYVTARVLFTQLVWNSLLDACGLPQPVIPDVIPAV
jgi:hypothetical protein